MITLGDEQSAAGEVPMTAVGETLLAANTSPVPVVGGEPGGGAGGERGFVARAGDAAGVAALYEEQAVMAYPPGGQTVGREAIKALWEKVLATSPRFEPEEPLPALVSGDIALTATVAKDGAGARAQVARRQDDGTWLRLLDLPELVAPTADDV